MRWVYSLCLVLGTQAGAEVLSGQATVVDGDTLRLQGQAVRLFGIDTPEADQTCQTSDGVAFACGEVATRAMQQLVAGKAVQCQRVDYDRFGRVVGRCSAEGQDIAAVMVRSGYATAYRRYSQDYVPLETAARADARGFWAGTMQDPAAFRARDRDAAPNPTCNLKGNISANGRILHQPGDDSYAATRINTAKGERWFCSVDAAIAAGWRPARR